VVGHDLNTSASPAVTARALITAALAVVAVVCWWLMARSAAVMASMQGDGVLLAAATAMMEPAATAPYLVASTLMWIVMMGAMMAPAALPITLVFVRLDRERHGRTLPLGGLLFAAGYLAAWALFAFVATALQWLLHRAALLHTDALAIGRPLAGAVLIVAGLYQLTPLKETCLAHCRTPMGFLLGHWRDGAGGAFRMGLHHGGYCLGCCWALMLLMFVAGVMSVTAMAVLSVFILAERLLPGRWAAQAPGAVLLGWGAWTLARTLG
jgi:predicted metal-binding membrane protein